MAPVYGHDPALAAPAAACDVLWLEVARGAWLSEPRPLLLVRDAGLAEEVCGLEGVVRGGRHARAPPSQGAASKAVNPAESAVPGAPAGPVRRLSQEDVDAVVADLGLVLQHAGAVRAHARAASMGPDARTHAMVAHKARRLLLFACDMGWACVAACMLPLATASCSCAAEVVAAVHASEPTCAQLPPPKPPQEQESQWGGAGRGGAAAGGGSSSTGAEGRHGLGLLHRVVRSGQLALLQGVLHWGAVAGYDWRSDRDGPGGITPMHLAVSAGL